MKPTTIPPWKHCRKNRGRNGNTDSMVCKLSLPVVAGVDIRWDD